MKAPQEMTDLELSDAVSEMTKAVSNANARLRVLQGEQSRRLLEFQKACKHPHGFPGFLVGICPDCGKDDY